MSARCSFRAASVLGGQHSNDEAPRQRAPIVLLSHGCPLWVRSRRLSASSNWSASCQKRPNLVQPGSLNFPDMAAQVERTDKQ